MMSFAELYKVVDEIVSPRESFLIEVNAWGHADSAATRETKVEWRVYVTEHGGNAGESVIASTPESVLVLARDKWGRPASMPIASVVIGEVGA